MNKNKLIREKDEQIDLLQNQLSQARTQPRELTDSQEAFGCQPIQTTAEQRKLLGAIAPLSKDENRSVSRAIFCSNF